MATHQLQAIGEAIALAFILVSSLHLTQLPPVFYTVAPPLPPAPSSHNDPQRLLSSIDSFPLQGICAFHWRKWVGEQINATQ